MHGSTCVLYSIIYTPLSTNWSSSKYFQLEARFLGNNQRRMDVISSDLTDFIAKNTNLVHSILEQLELCDQKNLNHLDNFVEQYQYLTSQMQNYEKAMAKRLALSQKSSKNSFILFISFPTLREDVVR